MIPSIGGRCLCKVSICKPASDNEGYSHIYVTVFTWAVCGNNKLSSRNDSNRPSFAIEASRERVPFPSVVEIIIMEFAFELIREAGLRVPSPIGPTLGIIGALILGQAAVAANIVSPILIIVVAVTGIGSFAIPNFSLGFLSGF